MSRYYSALVDPLIRITLMNSSSVSIFGFTTFISALALLVIVYTVTDIRYRFRVAITPIPLYVAKSCLIGSISFDEEKSRLLKTYARGLNLEPPKEYLALSGLDDDKHKAADN